MPCKLILLVVVGVLLAGDMSEVLFVVLLTDGAVLVLALRSALHLN
jgi:hypothetical protein